MTRLCQHSRRTPSAGRSGTGRVARTSLGAILEAFTTTRAATRHASTLPTVCPPPNLLLSVFSFLLISALFWAPGRGGESSVDMLILPSKDGLEWGPPRNVTASIKASGKIRVMFGMVNGIELRSGPHPHRIVVPGWALLNRVGATGHYDVSGTALMCKHPQRSPLVLALGAHAGRLCARLGHVRRQLGG